MKITKRQLRRIIKEEKARLREGRMAELEMQLVDEIVDLLIERGAVRQDPQRGYDDDLYQDALDYVRDAIVPTLTDLAARGAYDRK
tara:strand:- start:9 stop:266 length:258 start_codon:yes stop_codon:yes gene_type:complete